MPLDRMPREVSDKQRELASRMKFFYAPYDTVYQEGKHKDDGPPYRQYLEENDLAKGRMSREEYE